VTNNLSGGEALARLNAERAVIQIKGKVRIVGWEMAEHQNATIPVFSTAAEMRTFYANQFINVEVATGDGGFKTGHKPLFDYWLRHADRPTATGVTMEPDGDRFVGGRLNLWQGYGVERDWADTALIHGHIRDVICAGNAEHASYLTRWIAWSLQNPTKPAEVVVVLRGRKGTGKGQLGRLLCRLFGAHAMQISDRKHLVGSFNAHLLQVCFLYADEAFWPGDKAGEGPLKRMVTEPTLFIEPKGIDGFEVPNRLSIMMTSNEDWVVPASSDERRYVVFDVSDERRGDFAYFDALNAEIEDGGLGAFLDEMLRLDLKGWHPRQDVPETQGLADQKAQSASPMVNWLGALLEEGEVPAYVYVAGRQERIVHDRDPALARPSYLLHSAREQDRRLVHSTDVMFWKFLDDHGIHKADESRTARARFRRFPPLQDARRMFREKYPWWPEFSDQTATWRVPEHGRPSLEDSLRGEQHESPAE